MKLLFVIMLGLLGIVTVSAQENNLTKPPFEYVVLKSGRVVSPNVTVTQDLEITSKKVAIPIFEDEDIRFRFTSDVELGEKQVETLLAKGVCAFGEKHHDTELTSELFYLNIQSDVVVELAEQEDGTFHAGRSLSETSRSSWVRGSLYSFA